MGRIRRRKEGSFESEKKSPFGREAQTFNISSRVIRREDKTSLTKRRSQKRVSINGPNKAGNARKRLQVLHWASRWRDLPSLTICQAVSRQHLKLTHFTRSKTLALCDTVSSVRRAAARCAEAKMAANLN